MKAKGEFIAKWLFNDKGFVIGTERKEDLIRCKDCKFYSKGICWFDDNCYVWSDNDFCSRAERKEE